jgi:hypothetical protein
MCGSEGKKWREGKKKRERWEEKGIFARKGRFQKSLRVGKRTTWGFNDFRNRPGVQEPAAGGGWLKEGREGKGKGKESRRSGGIGSGRKDRDGW